MISPSTCKFMLCRNKGMIIVLIWIVTAWFVLNFGISSVFYTDGLEVLITSNKIYQYTFRGGILLLIALLCPVLGWIADAYWGRYKMIRQSFLIAWLTTIGICVVSGIPDNLPHIATIKETLYITMFVILFISTEGLIVNITQFGVDQLPDASSGDMKALSNWFVWAWYVGYAIVVLSLKCICSKYIALAKLLFPACLSLVLCLDYNFNHWLIKEPVTENPLKLIYKVMHFAWKDKYPRQRSAFTYCDDNRIDFAKHKFGGPFTTEKVEDVKTFWRMLLHFLTAILFVGFINTVQSVATGMRYHLRNLNFRWKNISDCSLEHTINCFQRETVYNFGYLIIILTIPLYELLLHRLIGRVSLFTKFNIGLFLSSILACF